MERDMLRSEIFKLRNAGRNCNEEVQVSKHAFQLAGISVPYGCMDGIVEFNEDYKEFIRSLGANVSCNYIIKDGKAYINWI